MAKQKPVALKPPPERPSSPSSMVDHDFFHGIAEQALSEKHGPLAVAARVLHDNRKKIGRKFQVITAADGAFDRFPKGRTSNGLTPGLTPWYIALASREEPSRALFIHFGLSGGLVFKEARYVLDGALEARGSCYFYPRMGKPRLWGRISRSQVSPQRVQAILDAYLARWPGR